MAAHCNFVSNRQFLPAFQAIAKSREDHSSFLSINDSSQLDVTADVGKALSLAAVTTITTDIVKKFSLFLEDQQDIETALLKLKARSNFSQLSPQDQQAFTQLLQRLQTREVLIETQDLYTTITAGSISFRVPKVGIVDLILQEADRNGIPPNQLLSLTKEDIAAASQLFRLLDRYQQDCPQKQETLDMIAGILRRDVSSDEAEAFAVQHAPPSPPKSIRFRVTLDVDGHDGVAITCLGDRADKVNGMFRRGPNQTLRLKEQLKAWSVKKR